MYGPGMVVGAGPGMPPARQLLEELAVDVRLVALLLGFLQQEEATEAEQRHFSLAVRRAVAVADRDRGFAALERADSVRRRLIVVALGVARAPNSRRN